ncbi:hypothetical protein C8A05DRAFT_46113 [Staphylotrichum tortipilum]|uniref:Post-SET domain-containing protein n=1 Tax=Staphylotrichum tortipilum TaxID=2831512 RepID=A0AAN6MFH9_9PEZI|nr:hypothetical protein C8A05DRAFT_46113 [Staphylotrichum longicolle]
MAQPFDCLCGKPTCRGRIAGARDMAPAQLDGLWLNRHIRELLEEKNTPPKKAAANGTTNGNGNHAATNDQTVIALRNALSHAEKVVDAARLALVSYYEATSADGGRRRGPTSRELSGEMGGDTSVHV